MGQKGPTADFFRACYSCLRRFQIDRPEPGGGGPERAVRLKSLQDTLQCSRWLADHLYLLNRAPDLEVKYSGTPFTGITRVWRLTESALTNPDAECSGLGYRTYVARSNLPAQAVPSPVGLNGLAPSGRIRPVKRYSSCPAPPV